MQLEFRLRQGQFVNKPGIVNGTHPKLWATHDAEGQLIVARVNEEQPRRVIGRHAHPISKPEVCFRVGWITREHERAGLVLHRGDQVGEWRKPRGRG